MSLVLKMTEVQPRISGVLQNRSEVTQVTYGRSNEPAIALVPWLLYSSWKIRFLQRTDGERISLVPKTMNMHKATDLFLSYQKRLFPLVNHSQTMIHVVEVTVHNEPVGAILSWSDWLLFAPPQEITSKGEDTEEAFTQERTFTVVTAAKHMAQFPVQFEYEQKQGRSEAIIVTKRGDPVFAIVPWDLYSKGLEGKPLHQKQE